MAWREVGHTRVSRPVAIGLVAMFLGTVGGIPVWQHFPRFGPGAEGSRAGLVPRAQDIVAPVPAVWRALSAGPGRSPWDLVVGLNRALLRGIHAFEDEIEEDSVLSAAVLPTTQSIMARFGAGNEKAYIGRDGWLFFRPDIDYLTGPGFLDPAWRQRRAAGAEAWSPAVHPDPLEAIVAFHEVLAARGIELVVVPTPSKATIHPAAFSGRLEAGQAPVRNPSFDRFVHRLAEAGIVVFDPAPLLLADRAATGADQYLATDTHWRPEAMERVAAGLAGVIAARLDRTPERPSRFALEEARVTHLGDIAAMLRLPAGQTLFSPEVVTIRQVLDDRGGIWRPDPAADVLLLGDSFSNIFSLGDMGWGESAGLAEHLSVRLGRSVDCILRNDDGAHATREILARDLRRGRDRLAGKRLVAWQFSVRELAFGDWRPVPMELGEPRERRFLVPPAGETWSVTGVVEDVSPAPRPGRVPYKDHIVSVHLADVAGAAGRVEGADALVYLWSMRDNAWTEGARLRKGATVALKLRPWSEVSARLDRINRSELPDMELQLEEPCWGEWVPDR